MRQQQEGVKRRFVQLLLKDHDYETDPWPWGGEPIYLEDRVVGRVTTSAYGFTLNTHVRICRRPGGEGLYQLINIYIYIYILFIQVCLGFVENLDEKGERNVVTNDYILKNEFYVDIGGMKVPVKANIHSPTLAYKGVSKERTYFATQ